GKRVLILEHGGKIGGNIQGIRRKGYFFDAGSQSTESVGILFPVLEELGLYDPDHWDRAVWRWTTPDCDVVLRDYDQIREDFKCCFPESSPDIDGWFDFIVPGCLVMKDMMKDLPFPLLKRGLDKYRVLGKMSRAGMGFMPMIREAMTKGGGEKGKEIFRDPRLAFLFGEFGNPNMLLFMFFSFWYSFLYDYWYPKGGLISLADMLARSFRELGGEVVTSCTVDKILSEGDRAVGVETSGGDRYYAGKIVNTGNPKRLVREMCDPSLFPHKYREKMLGAPVSTAVSTAFLGLNIPDGELARTVRCNHVLYWRTYEAPVDIYDPDLHRKGWAMISWVSMHDKSLAPEGKNSIIVQVQTPYDWMNGWGTGSSNPLARGEGYRNLKAKVLDDVIRDCEYIIPGLRDKVEYKELATPRTLSRYTLNPEGSIMGWSYDMYRTPLYGRFGRFKTPVKNLYQAGHYSVWPGGIVFSALSGKIVADGMYEGVARTLLW
ncbi:MAG: phytoene desaturase family protein, partial [Actinomycetota bacterium]